MLNLVAASLIWSLSFGLIGNLLGDLPPAWLALVRTAIAATLFAPFAKRLPARACIALMSVGAVQLGLMSLAYMWSFRYLESHEVALFAVMTPLYVAVASDLCEGRLRTRNLGVALLAVGGAALILWRGAPAGAPLRGFLLVELSNLCFALGQIAYRETLRRLDSRPADHQALFWLYLGGVAALLPFALPPAIAQPPRPTQSQVLALLYMGVAVSGLGYFLWNRGVRRVSGAVLAVMNNLKIPLAVAVSLLFFGEQARLAGLLAGSLLILGAIVAATYTAKRE